MRRASRWCVPCVRCNLGEARRQCQVLSIDRVLHVCQGQASGLKQLDQYRHDLPVRTAIRGGKRHALNRHKLLPQVVEPVVIGAAARWRQRSDLRLSCSTGTLEALYDTTIGAWMPGGITVRTVFVAGNSLRDGGVRG